MHRFKSSLESSAACSSKKKKHKNGTPLVDTIKLIRGCCFICKSP